MHPTPTRSPINLGAIIGVAFVFLCGVVVWVLVGSTGDDDTEPIAAPSTATTSTVAPVTAPPEATSPVPLPATQPSATSTPPTSSTTSSAPPTSATTTTAPNTAATTAPPTSVTTTTVPTPAPVTNGGDLGVPGQPIDNPDCTDAYITVIASAVNEVTAANIAPILDDYPDAKYLRTDQACPSLTQSVNGQPVYVVYFGPFGDAGDACEARAKGTSDAYVRLLSTSAGPGHSVDCG